MNGEIIGEYDKDLDGEFIIVEVADGFMAPASRRKEDPVVYLFEKALA